MKERLARLYEAIDSRDIAEIAILVLVIYVVLRILSRTRGSGLMRGLGIFVVGVFLVAQLVLASFDLAELGRLLDQVLTTAIIGLLIIFQPELRRALLLLGRHRGLRMFTEKQKPVADVLIDAVTVMSREKVGALIAIQREMSLNRYVETGQRIDSEISVALLRALFHHHSPLHDGAIVLGHGRLLAAGCQLPLAQHTTDGPRTGMRHRAAIGLSDETDAILLVVSEESGRLSIAVQGRLHVVERDQLRERLLEELAGQVKLVTFSDRQRTIRARITGILRRAA